MGCVHSSNTAQRCSHVILNIVEARLDASFEALLEAKTGLMYGRVREWRAHRMKLFP